MIFLGEVISIKNYVQWIDVSIGQTLPDPMWTTQSLTIYNPKLCTNYDYRRAFRVRKYRSRDRKESGELQNHCSI